MGFLDIFKQGTTPTVSSILPDVAKNEIMNGRLPILNTNKVFLKAGETCHYIDKAIYEKKNVKKRYVRRGGGYSIPGILKGSRWRTGGGATDVQDNVQYETIKGILFVTNKRVIFVGEAMGFDKKIDDIVALTPYANCVDIQFSKENYKLFVPDGNVLNAVFQQIA